MKEFFVSIVNWFAINKDGIIAFLTSSNVVGFVTAIVLLVRQIRASKDNTRATGILTESMKLNNELGGTVTETQIGVKKVLLENQALKQKLLEQTKNLEDFKDAIFTKINAMMDVQSIVYATIKDEKTRVNVMNLLTNAKFAENKTRAELEAEVESLRDALATKVEDVKKLADEAVENIKKTVAVETKEEVQETEVVRY